MRIFLFIIILFSLSLASCKRCYECKCYLNGQEYDEDECVKGIDNTSAGEAANYHEVLLEKEKGYEECVCLVN